LAIFTFLVYLHLRQRYSSLPAGPWGLPVLGYLPWLDPVAPYASLASLVPKYGKVFTVSMGGLTAVVICDVGVMRRAFSKQVFSGRAPLYLTHGIMKGLGLICSEGDHWAEQRRWAQGVLRRCNLAGPGLGERLEEPVRELMEELEGVGEDWVDLHKLLTHIVGNLMNKTIFGMTYTRDSGVWAWLKELREEGIKKMGVAGPVNFLPWLRHLPSIARDIAFIKLGQVDTHKEYDRIIGQRMGRLEEGEDAECITDEFLKEVEGREAAGEDVKSFTRSQLHHLQADIFGAGLDTTMTTILWTLLHLSCPRNLHIQAALTKQIDRVRQDGSPALLEDDLPLLRASILETQRLRPVTPMGVPHGSLGTARLDGWVLPKGTILLPLHWFINRDPELWNNPDTFNPARFLGVSKQGEAMGSQQTKQTQQHGKLSEEAKEEHSDAEIALDILTEGHLVENPNLLPFQAGRRRCLGEELGKSAVFLFLARIFQRFSVILEPGYDVDQVPEHGFTLAPHPFKLKLTPRNKTNMFIP